LEVATTWLTEWWTSLSLTLPTDFFVKESIKTTWAVATKKHSTFMGILLTVQLLVQGFLVFEIASAIRNKVKR
jgi:hypothetical protein